MNKADKLELCSGCRNNRYNMGKGYCERPGVDSPVTCTECWNLEGATVVRRRLVPYSQTPPWEQAPVRVLSCYSREGYACVEPG
jgi:hypothetical protein